MLSSNFPYETDEEADDREEEWVEIKEVLQTLEELAKLYEYLDDYPILVLEESQTPIIIMNPDEFKKLNERVIGTG